MIEAYILFGIVLAALIYIKLYSQPNKLMNYYAS